MLFHMVFAKTILAYITTIPFPQTHGVTTSMWWAARTLRCGARPRCWAFSAASEVTKDAKHQKEVKKLGSELRTGRARLVELFVGVAVVFV